MNREKLKPVIVMLVILIILLFIYLGFEYLALKYDFRLPIDSNLKFLLIGAIIGSTVTRTVMQTKQNKNLR